MPERFQKSASDAVAFMSGILGLSEHDSSRIASPQMLEMLTLCRETGLRLPTLEVFSKVCDNGLAVTLLGGDAELAKNLARCVGLTADLQDIPETPLIWWIESARSTRTVVEFGATERELSETALNALLSTALPPDRVTVVRRKVESDSEWRFAWLPDIDSLVNHAAWPAVLETFIGAQVMIAIRDELPAAFQSWFSRPGMIARQYSATEIVRDDVRPVLFSELCAMREQSFAEREAMIAATWSYLIPKLVDQLDALRQQNTIEIDRQNMKLQLTRQTLGEYRRNWSNGIRNLLDDFFNKKNSGTAMSALIDPRQPGPQPGTYLQALALPSLWKQLSELMNERLGEFVQGLGALAIRVELRSISLKDFDMKWNPSSIAQSLEEELQSRRVFSEGGGARAGIVGALIGKSEEIAGLRRGQIVRANKTVQQQIEQDFLEWADRLFHSIEQRVRVQIAASQANQGLPDIETLRTSLTGIDRLTAMLEGNREGAREEPVRRVAQLLRSWSQRRWIRRYLPAA